jgi:hypothetical protein
MYGKWSQPNVPKKGWSCIGVEDQHVGPNPMLSQC